MKYFKSAMMLLSVVGCSCAQQQKSQSFSDLTIKGFSFHQTKAPLFSRAVESSSVVKDNKLIYLIDLGEHGNLSVGTSNNDLVSVGNDARFAYIMQYQNVYYNFFNRGGSIFASKSLDLITWTPINRDQPVLSQTVNSIYNAVWNVGVTVDDQGVFHLLAETSVAGNEIAGLAYATATMQNDEINFDLNRSTNHVLTLAGNPWVGFVQGKGLVAVYGKMIDGIWAVTAATFENNQWTENPNFIIGGKDIHVCDPHVTSFNGELVMSVSYEQDYIYELRSNQTLEQFFNQVKGI
jgi:hypothetical protein